MQTWVGPASTALMARREFKEGSSEGSLRRNRQNAAPPQNPRGSRCAATAKMPLHRRTHAALAAGRAPGRQPRGRERTIRQMSWPLGPTGPRPQFQKPIGGSGVPGQVQGTCGVFCPGRRGPRQRQVATPPLRTRLPVMANRADGGGINSMLLAVPERQSIADDFDASGILDGHVKVHICQPHVLCDPCASLSAPAPGGWLARHEPRKASVAGHAGCVQQLRAYVPAALATCHTKKPNGQSACRQWQSEGQGLHSVLAAARFAVAPLAQGCLQSRGGWLNLLQLRCHAVRHSEL